MAETGSPSGTVTSARLDRSNDVAALGLTVKSGWASAVLLTRAGGSLRVADSRIVVLADPKVPDARQPYHDGFGTARAAGAGLSRLLASVRRFGRKSISDLLRQYADDGHQIGGAGIVVGSIVDPRTIGNDHIRIHALEGQLFRTVVMTSLSKRGVNCLVCRERDLIGTATERLGRKESALRTALLDLGRDVSGSWRAEQKAAALAAWIVLDRRRAG
jgi:hypothetical protein